MFIDHKKTMQNALVNLTCKRSLIIAVMAGSFGSQFEKMPLAQTEFFGGCKLAEMGLTQLENSIIGWIRKSEHQ